MVNLIILDLYGTIVHADERSASARNGFRQFLDFYKESGAKLVVFSDGDRDTVESSLQLARLSGQFDGVYDGHDLIYHNHRILKNLGKVCGDFSIEPSDAVFIGDDSVGRDSESAEFYRIRFVKVPQYRSTPPSWHGKHTDGRFVDYEDPQDPFSFKSLIGQLEETE